MYKKMAPYLTLKKRLKNDLLLHLSAYAKSRGCLFLTFLAKSRVALTSPEHHVLDDALHRLLQSDLANESLEVQVSNLAIRFRWAQEPA